MLGVSLCPAAGLSRGRLGSGPAADGLRLGEAPTSAPCPLGPSPRLCARGAWPHGRALSQKNEGIEGKCLPGNGGAGRIQLLKFLVWEEQSPQLASNWPMWLQPPPPTWAALWHQASFSSLVLAVAQLVMGPATSSSHSKQRGGLGSSRGTGARVQLGFLWPKGLNKH